MTFDEADGAVCGHQRGRGRGGGRHRRAAEPAGGRGPAGRRRLPVGAPTRGRRSPAGVSRGADPRHRAGQLGRDLRRRRGPAVPGRRAGGAAVYAELGIAHPGWVLRLANRILSGNVVLGPGSTWAARCATTAWSTTAPRSAAGARSPRSTSARATASCASTSASWPTSSLVATVDHTAIYQPRQVTAGRLAAATAAGRGSVQRPTTSGSPAARFTSTPNRRCATRRIWISSDPSVMR